MAATLSRKLSLALRHSELGWRYAFNLAPSVGYRMSRRELPAEGRRVVGDLNENGIAITAAEALLGSPSLYGELEGEVERLERENAQRLAALKTAANDTTSIGNKTFLHQLLGSRPRLDAGSIFARFALQERVLDIVNAYFGMFTRLREYNVWRTFVTSTPARESQLWHRDREDRLIVKVFVYLNDVDEGAGPFTYAPGTHQKGPVRQTPEFFMENGVRRSSDEQMEKVVPREQWIRALGAKGTIIFTDTHGYHKGGHAWRSDRLMYTSLFTSPASESGELMTRPAQPVRFPDVARTVALAPPRRRFWLTLPPAGGN